MAAILALQGYHATAFTSPLKALEAARRNAPDILISDVMMSDLSGIDLAILMNAQFPHCKIPAFFRLACLLRSIGTGAAKGDISSSR